MLYGLDPAQRLSAAIETINDDHRDIDFVIVTGDLAHNGERAAYEHLRTVLAELRAPVILMLGNHDSRLEFRAAFPEVIGDHTGFIQSMRVFEGGTMITLDTLNEGGRTHAGRLCASRLAFLERALKDAPLDRPLILFQHHPPFDTGLPHMDAIRLDNADDEWEVIRRTRRPDFLFVGHVHRPIGGVWRGVPFQIQRGINHQVAFDLAMQRYIQPRMSRPTIRSFPSRTMKSSCFSVHSSMTGQLIRLMRIVPQWRNRPRNWVATFKQKVCTRRSRLGVYPPNT
jgi:3',5'-cyclic-AMP phosphodiesterase